MKKLKIIVSGFIGLYPTGGVTWDYIQYVLGFKLLGHDVYYIEDTGQYATYRISERAWNDPHDTVEYLRKTMASFGLAEQWAYRDTYSGECYGMSLNKVLTICATADLFVNVSAASIIREEYFSIPGKILIDSDPMFTQLQSSEKVVAGVEEAVQEYSTTPFGLYDYDYYFSFGENIGKPDCRVPEMELNWISTRQPVCMELWQNSSNSERCHTFSTVMNWSTRGKMVYDNQTWGQKDVEFRKFINIPKWFPKAEFQVNMAVSKDYKEELNAGMLNEIGWTILSPAETISTPSDYQLFIRNSDAEFSIAKETYVKSNSGWFSCRSACYLASGKPVVTQETGWSQNIPAGEGLYTFTERSSAVNALEQVFTGYHKSCVRSREIAYEYFSSNKILSKLLNSL